MTRQIGIIAGLVVAASLSVMGVHGIQAAEPEAKIVRMAYAGGVDFSKVNQYKWEELLATKGITVKASVFNSSQDAFRAVLAGEADVTEGTILSVMLIAQTQKGGVKLIVTNEQEADYLLISRAEVNNLNDLIGRRVGISQPGDTSDTLSRLMLARKGIDVSKVKFLQIGGTNARMAGLLAGQLDAGIAHAAEGLNAAEKGGLKVLFSVASAVPEYLQGGLLTTDAWLAKHPILAQTVVDAYIDGNRWAHDNKDAYIALSKERVPGLSDAARLKAWDFYRQIGKFALNGGLLPKQLQNTVAIEKEVGNIKGDVPDVSLWVNDAFVKSYLARNGMR